MTIEKIESKLELLEKEFNDFLDKEEQRRRNPERRYCLEFFMKSQDEMYHSMMIDHVNREIKKERRKMAAFVATSTAISCGITAIAFFTFHKKQ